MNIVVPLLQTLEIASIATRLAKISLLGSAASLQKDFQHYVVYRTTFNRIRDRSSAVSQIMIAESQTVNGSISRTRIHFLSSVRDNLCYVPRKGGNLVKFKD